MENLILPRILITGASAGIGRATALKLATRVSNMFLVARREDKLKELESELKTLNPKLSVKILACDINDKEIVQKISDLTNSHVDILINNAGLALGKDKIQNSLMSDFEQMINTNILANFRIVHGILPWMLKNGQGDIINLCSIAGHETYPGGGVYCATKHAVFAFTKVLREETAGKNIRVMQMSPGMVNTEFSAVRFKGDQKTIDTVYTNMMPLLAEDIARMMAFMLEQPRHVVIDEMITMPSQQGSPVTIVRNSK